MKVTSREITYRTATEQVFFDDGYSLVIKTGWVEDTPWDTDTTIKWDSTPDWAKELTDQELLEIIERGAK